MKHVLGYGILGVALVGALVLGHHSHSNSITTANWGHQGRQFDIDVQDKYDSSHATLTDHPQDSQSTTNKFTWTLGEAFTIEFVGDSPCTMTYSTTGGNTTATCTLSSTLPKPVANACPANESPGVKCYGYDINLTNHQFIDKNGHPMSGIKTCDGCLLAVE